MDLGLVLGADLSVLPLITDAVRMRYLHPLKGIPRTCACSQPNSIDHALSCPKGGYIYLRHNQIRDLEVHWLSTVCKDVQAEPKLLPLNGEQFQNRTAVVANDARADINNARGVWSGMDKTFFDVRVFHPGAASNTGDIKAVYKRHESEKKMAYDERILEVERATFTPLIFSTTGGMGREAVTYHKRLASLISSKRGTS